MNPYLEEALKFRVYSITKRIAIGQFATKDRASHLLQSGITHIVNVGEAKSIAEVSSHGFEEIIDIPIIDLNRILDDLVIHSLDTIHRILLLENSKVFLHCIACQNRSPTILWLYLLACGLDTDESKKLITDRCPDAVPGHGSLVDDDLVELVKAHGRQHFAPIDDPAILEPAY